MKKEEVRKWVDSTRKTLDACRKFSKLCGKPFDRGFIGELLVLERLLKTYGAKLCSFAANGFQYVGSANKRWDISLTLGKKTVYLNAKATRVKDKTKNPRWVRQQAKTYCVIEVDPETSKQIVGKEIDIDNGSNLFYVFVDVDTWIKHGTTNFFTLSHKKAAEIFSKKYSRLYHNRVRESRSTDFWIEYKDVKEFTDPNLRRLFKQ
ncbi:MAG: hypothetical protein UY50_C0008G0009 [Parcubacteria group bacterium GW2011_GWA2_49_9]|nr:MAG: hypothetical protein UY50_C0008G0009 [Parcubacteria group bacterium GW2011_GWA2_49_9]